MGEAISLINPPKIEFVFNNAGGKDLRCLDYQYYIKSLGKKAASFRCSGKGCYASICLKTQTIEGEVKPKIIEPFIITYLNLDYASDYESGDCRFDPCQTRTIFSFYF